MYLSIQLPCTHFFSLYPPLSYLQFPSQELFPGSKYKFKSEGTVHSIVVNKPTVDDMGRYTVECMGISCSAILTVQGRCYIFLRPLAFLISYSPCYSSSSCVMHFLLLSPVSRLITPFVSFCSIHISVYSHFIIFFVYLLYPSYYI